MDFEIPGNTEYVSRRCKMTICKLVPEIMDPGDVDLIEWPLKKVVEGNPRAAYSVIGRSDDARSFSGLWQCTPGKFDVTYTWDETFYVLEGLVSIEGEDGKVRQFKGGDVVHFPIGYKCTWTVHQTIKKMYALFSPKPLGL